MNMRNIKQVAIGSSGTAKTPAYDTIVALCDDGTAWVMFICDGLMDGLSWRRLPDVPPVKCIFVGIGKDSLHE